MDFFSASHKHSLAQLDSTTAFTTDTKSISTTTTTHPHSSTKKARTQPRQNKSSLTTKGNKLKTTSSTVGNKAKHSDINVKKRRNETLNQMILTSTGLTAKPIHKISTPQTSTNKTAIKSITNAVISYLHYRGANGGHVTGRKKIDTGKINLRMCIYTSIA